MLNKELSGLLKKHFIIVKLMNYLMKRSGKLCIKLVEMCGIEPQS